MSEDFIYERQKLSEGLKLETVTGGTRYKGKTWRDIAMQIYCENGKEGYRDLGHFNSGAPFLYDSDERISISHTDSCLVVATRKLKEENIDLSSFTPETALGVDVESGRREKVMELRNRFLTPDEMQLVSSDSLQANIIAWTCKEAMLKAGMDPGINWRNSIIITSLPSPGKNGSGYIVLGGRRYDLELQTLLLDHFIITVAS